MNSLNEQLNEIDYVHSLTIYTQTEVLNTQPFLVSTNQWIVIDIANVTLACEQQTHFRSSLLSLRKIAFDLIGQHQNKRFHVTEIVLPLGFADAIFRRERSDDRKCVCCSQANVTRILGFILSNIFHTLSTGVKPLDSTLLLLTRPKERTALITKIGFIV